MSKPRGSMPNKKARDEAYLRTLQVDLEDDIAVAARETLQSTNREDRPTHPAHVHKTLPASCPACGEGLERGRPDIWTHMRLHTPSAERPNFVFRLQCGHCGYIVMCEEKVWDEARQLRLDTHARYQRVREHREKRYHERGSE